MRDPLFHIGYHRTSTTWFQEVFYPSAQGTAALPRAVIRKHLIEPRAFTFDPAAARAALNTATGGARLIACEENLSGYIHNGGLGGLLSQEMANRIHAALPEARIIVFLRSQPDVVAASYAQYVRGGGTADIRGYVLGQANARGAAKYWYKAPMFAIEHFRYGPLLAHYRALFGAERVHVRLFEAFRADKLAFLERFAADFALSVDLAEVPLERINASLSPRAMAILRRLNLLTARSVQNKRVLADWKHWYDRRWIALKWIEGLSPAESRHKGHAPLPDDIQALIAEHCAPDNAALAAEWNLPLRAFGYPLPATIP